MKNWVKEKLKVIDDLYPQERLAASKARWGKIWNGQKGGDRLPFVYSPLSFNYYNDNHSPEERLRTSLDEFILRGKFNDDFIPSFFPGCKQSTIPSMFGAPEIRQGDEFICEQIIFEAKDIDELPEPSVSPGTVARQWLAMQSYLLEETEGTVPVHVTDMQGPVDVGAQMWGYDNLLLAPYTEPEYYHKFMKLITRAYIMFWDAQKKLLGDNFLGTHLFGWSWVPPGNGATLSADSLVMVSDDYYKQFFKPYFLEIGRRYNGITVHSCGDFSATIESLSNTEYVKAVNAGQMNINQLLQAGINPECVIIAICITEDIAKTVELIKNSNLRVDLTISDFWPESFLVDAEIVNRKKLNEKEKIIIDILTL